MGVIFGGILNPPAPPVSWSGFEMRWIWYLSVVAVALLMSMNLLILQRLFRIRLAPAPARS